MNNDNLDQLPAEERRAAAQLTSAAQHMQVPPDFQWELEKQLMEKYKTNSQPAKRWSMFGASLAWGIAAVVGVWVLSWSIRLLIPAQNPQPASLNPAVSFETTVRQGNACAGTLALAHGYWITTTNEDKTQFASFAGQNDNDEYRAFEWSADGKQLAILVNSMGNGNILISNMDGSEPRQVMTNSQVGYLMGFDWSRDSEKFVMWSLQDNTTIWLVNADGSDLQQIALSNQIFGAPQFMPDGEGLLYYGANTSSAGLFEYRWKAGTSTLVNPLVESETGFAFSPTGAQFAYLETDRTTGEARLVVEEVVNGDKTIIATLPIPKGSGANLPKAANMNWSTDGKALVFEFGNTVSDRVIHLARLDGSALIQLADSAHAPALSPDGNCLAYISDRHVFLLDLSNLAAEPVRLAEVPAGHAITDFKLDQLQWSP